MCSLEQQKDAAVEFAAEEAARCRAEVVTMQEKMRELDGENKMLIERWLELKMHEVERINEASFMAHRTRAYQLEHSMHGPNTRLHMDATWHSGQVL